MTAPLALTLLLAGTLVAQTPERTTPREAAPRRTTPQAAPASTVPQTISGYLIDTECQPFRNAVEEGKAPGTGKPPEGCAASISTARFGLYGNGRVMRFDDNSNEKLKTMIESTTPLKTIMVNNSTSPNPLVMTAKGTLQGYVMHVLTIRRGR